MSLFALKLVGSDFKSALLGRVAPGGLNAPTLDLSYALTYTVGGSTTAVQMPDHPAWTEAPAAPAFSACANFSGNSYPTEAVFVAPKQIDLRTMEGLDSSTSWIIELEFDEADIVKTFRPSPYTLDVWLSQASVTRQFSQTGFDKDHPGDWDGYDILSPVDVLDSGGGVVSPAIDPAAYIVPEVA